MTRPRINSRARPSCRVLMMDVRHARRRWLMLLDPCVSVADTISIAGGAHAHRLQQRALAAA